MRPNFWHWVIGRLPNIIQRQRLAMAWIGCIYVLKLIENIDFSLFDVKLLVDVFV